MNDNFGDAPEDTIALDAAAVRAFHDHLDDPVDTDKPLEEMRALSELQNAITARMAHLATAADDAQHARDTPRGITGNDTTRLVGSHVGHARRCSPHHGRRFVTVARALTADMPHTLTALAAGVISEWDATRIVGETAHLCPSDRAAVDAAIADQLGRAATGRLAAAARAHASRIDPDGSRARRVHAHGRRRVSLRPAPDSMAYLTALLPAKDGLACMAALEDAVSQARRRTAADDDSSRACRGQVMADTLVERVTGRRCADSADIHVNLLIPIDSLTGNTPAHVPGYGPVPADLVQDWLTRGDPTGPLVRRLFTHPGTGDIIGMESRARRYPGLLALLILLRDQTCRTPWCGAPIRHTDHIRPYADGGATSERNGQGLCAGCNYLKEHPDHSVTGTTAETTTHTGGFSTTSRPPAPPGLPPPTRSHIERTLIDITWYHHVTGHDEATDDDGTDEPH